MSIVYAERFLFFFTDPNNTLSGKFKFEVGNDEFFLNSPKRQGTSRQCWLPNMFLPFAFRFSPFPITITIHRDRRPPSKAWLIEGLTQGTVLAARYRLRPELSSERRTFLYTFGYSDFGDPLIEPLA